MSDIPRTCNFFWQFGLFLGRPYNLFSSSCFIFLEYNIIYFYIRIYITICCVARAGTEMVGRRWIDM